MNSKLCPTCKSPLAGTAPEGLCPKCLWASLLSPDLEGLGIESALPSAWPGLPGALGTSPCIFGDYDLLNEIARGGMGVVYRARQISLQRVVALKMILTARLPGEADMRRFRAEAEAVAGLEHPNIVPIHEVGEHEGHPYFTMKFIPGGSLDKRILDFGFSSGDLADNEARHEKSEIANRQTQIAKLLVKIARAIHHAHQHGILHRDLKPSNILLDERDEPLVTDFGLAKQLEADNNLTLSGTVLGTPAYIAPEQAAGGKSLTVAVDVYSLGAIFYELLTGRPPFQAETPLEVLRQVVEREIRRPSSIHRGVERDLETICLKCLRKEPAQRYSSAGALAEDLERWLRHEPIRARPSTWAERVLKWARRHPARMGLIVLGMLTPAVVIGLLLVAEGNLRRERNNALEHERKARIAAAGAETAAQEAITAREQTRLNLYAADMLLAHHALEDGNLDLARRLIESYRSESVVPASAGPGTNAVGTPESSEARTPEIDGLKAGFPTDLRGFEWRHLWQRCQGDERETLPDHSNPVHSLAFSPDAQRLASGDAWGKVKLWNMTSRRCFHTFQASEVPIVRITFSPDGLALATGDKSGRVKVWNLATYQAVWHHQGRNMAGVQFSPAGSLIGVTSGGLGNPLPATSIARVIDWTTGMEVFQAGPIADFEAFSPDAKLAIVTRNKEVGTEIWDLETGKVIKTVPDINASLVVSPDGEHFAAGWPSRGILLAELTTSQPAVWLNAKFLAGSSLAFSADSTLLAIASPDQVVRLWNVAEGAEVGRLLGHVGPVTGVAFSPDGKWMATSGLDHNVILWPTASKKDAAIIYNTWPPYVLSPDGTKLAGWAGTDITARDELRVWDLGTLQSMPLAQPEKPPMPEFFSEDSQTLFARGEVTSEGLLPLMRWNLNAITNAPEVTLLNLENTNNVMYAATAPSGNIYALAQHRTKIISMWHPENGNHLGDLDFSAEQEPVGPHRFSPDNRKLLLYTWRNKLHLLDIATPEKIRSLVFSTDFDQSAFSPDSKLLAVPCADHTIRVLDTLTLEEVACLRGHQNAVVCVAFSPDGRTIASSGGGVVKLWCWPARREAATLARGVDYHFLAFSPDGDRLIGGGYGQTRIFHVPSLAEIDRGL